jgi:hypothetical protein
VNYRSVTAAGDVLVRDHLRSLVKVAYVDFKCDESQGNPVVTYLQCQGLKTRQSQLLWTYDPHY